MLSYIDPFSTFYSENPDFNQSDSENEFNALHQRQSIIQSAIFGEVESDTVLDCLNDQGIDVDEYVNAVVENVDYVIDNGIEFDDLDVLFVKTDSGLLLPCHGA